MDFRWLKWYMREIWKGSSDLLTWYYKSMMCFFSSHWVFHSSSKINYYFTDKMMNENDRSVRDPFIVIVPTVSCSSNINVVTVLLFLWGSVRVRLIRTTKQPLGWILRWSVLRCLVFPSVYSCEYVTVPETHWSWTGKAQFFSLSLAVFQVGHSRSRALQMHRFNILQRSTRYI